MAKPNADLSMRVDLPLDKKTVVNQDWASGPPGHRGPWATGQWAAGRQAAGLLWAVGHRPAFSKTHHGKVNNNYNHGEIHRNNAAFYVSTHSFSLILGSFSTPSPPAIQCCLGEIK